MARYILFTLFLFLLYAILRHLMNGVFKKQGKKLNRQPEPEELVQDPSCRTYISKRFAVRKKEAGRNYYFCSQECLRKFFDERKS